MKIRIHGDYRLGQVLLAEGDVSIQNIEGHLAWPAAAQREKQSPLRDVASMLRSFSYAAYAALRSRGATASRSARASRPLGADLGHTGRRRRSCVRTLASGGAARPAADDQRRETLLQFFMVDRALRELDGELNNRAEWVGIPLSGLVDLLGSR